MSQEAKEKINQYVAKIWTSPEMAEHWQRGLERRQRAMAEGTMLMLDAVQLKPGDQVLDVAAGTGDQGRLAAKRVAPHGSVLITDISAQMLIIANRLAEKEGVTNTSTKVMSAESLELEDNHFDAVICRYGLEALANVPQALREIYRVLKPGGRFAALTPSVPEKNPLVRFLAMSSQKRAQAANAKTPTPFAFSRPEVFAQLIEEAGFQQVKTQTVPFQFQYPSLEEFLLASTREIASAGASNEEERQARLQEMREAFAQFEGPEGLVLPGEGLLGAGLK